MTGNGALTLAEALKAVIDPELGYNIVDIGLVYDAEIADGKARVLLTTTTPGCPATEYIRRAVETCAAAQPGVDAVEVTMTWSPPWSPDLMSDAAKAHFRVRS
jgi:metal-sulfur cluster biosynthetic enzyme